jgi:hypothetical protein
MMRVMDWIAVRAHNQVQVEYAKMLRNLVIEYETSQKWRTKPQLAGLGLLKAVTESNACLKPSSPNSWILSMERCPKSCLALARSPWITPSV